MIQHGNLGQLGEGVDAPSDEEEKEEVQALSASRHSFSRDYERLILCLGISALVCLGGLVFLRFLGQISMLLFLLTVGQLMVIGGLIGVRAAVVILRFHIRKIKERSFIRSAPN